MSRCLPILLLVLASMAAHAQQPPLPPPPACQSAEHRQFDFWLGQWTVIGGPKGDRVVGRSSITKVADGCALAEHWVNNTGVDGHSLNVYDSARKQWTQFWIGSDGVILHLRGGMQGSEMVLEGELPAAKGGVQRQQIRWTPAADGAVVQTWRTSDDGGASWQISFRGTYRPLGRPTP